MTCTVSSAGTELITATLPADSISNCTGKTTSVVIAEPDNAVVTCDGPFYLREPFSCSVSCNGETVTADWSIASGSCTSQGEITQCTTEQSTVVTASNAGTCNPGNASIELSYDPVALSCDLTEVNSGFEGLGNGQLFNCSATGGDEDYTWSYPEYVIDDGDASAAEEQLHVTFSSTSQFPSDNKVTLEVRDSRFESATFEITLTPPSILVESLYRVGNDAISPGSSEELYLQLNAL